MSRANSRHRLGLVPLILIGLGAGTAQAAPLTGGTGPGGVGTTDGSSNLKVWLKADALLGSTADGAAVGGAGSEWTDSSGSGNFGQAYSDSGRRPIFRASGARLLNGNPIVEFDGANDRLYLSSPILTLTGLGSDLSVFSVTKLDVLSSFRDTILSGYDGGNGGLDIDITNADVYRMNHQNADGSHRRAHFQTGTTTPSLVNPEMVSFVSGPTAIELRLNGSVEASNTYSNLNPTPNDNVAIGGVDIVASNPFDGSFAEIVLFNTNVNAAQRIIVENYLQAKYNDSTADNLSIADDKYAGDTTANGDYDLDVFGVGQIGGVGHTNSGAAGLGVEVIGALDDDEWGMAGHNAPTNSIVPVEAGSSILSGERWNRVWYADIASTDGFDTTVAFDFSDGGLAGQEDPDASYTLLFSPTQSFDWIRAGVGTLAGDTVTFNVPGLDGTQDGYITLGVDIVVPEPSALLVWSVLAGLAAWLTRRKR